MIDTAYDRDTDGGGVMNLCKTCATPLAGTPVLHYGAATARWCEHCGSLTIGTVTLVPTHLAEQRAEGRGAERRAVVAWLDAHYGPEGYSGIYDVARDIEAGRHVKGEAE
jgi:hypothetical protein